MPGAIRALLYQKSGRLSCRPRPVAGALAAVLAAVSLLLTAAPASELVDARDLQADARGLIERPRPILLEFAARHCSYCDLLETEIIRPMLMDPAIEERVLVRRS